MHIDEALRAARAQLTLVSETASGDAQVLLAEVLGVPRAYVLAHPDHALTAEQERVFAEMVARCARGEPLPYVLGRRAWYDREFYVTPDVLIPRPETELLLEEALRWCADREASAIAQPVAVDVGTGSGVLAVTFAALRQRWHVFAVDISPSALAVARENAARHSVQTQVTFLQSDLLSAFADQPACFDLIMANLPYIPTQDLDGLAVAAHEPRLALAGGLDGLVLIRGLLAQARTLLRPAGMMLLEIEARQGAAVATAARQMFPNARLGVLRDYAGLDRIVKIVLS
jgi:release factor glutamine methyltransferase